MKLKKQKKKLKIFKQKKIREECGVFQSEKDNDNNFITPTYESGSV